MNPEISQRCLSCGASVRAAARFCQQCGQDMKRGGRNAAVPAGEVDASAGAAQGGAGAPVTGELTENWALWEESVRAQGEDVRAAGQERRQARPGRGEKAPSAGAEPKARRDSSGAAGAPASARDDEASGAVKTGAGLRDRAAGAKRRPVTIVRENLSPRVKKMREASIVALEEAAEDSGLRFVLIAVALFLLFLLFLFVSSFLR